MAYRTKTYIAGDWDGDKDAIGQLYKWKESKYLSLDFIDAHDLHQARDTSLNCSIKKSLQQRLDVSKRFVLVVGEKTKNLRSGGCQLCSSYNSWTSACARGYRVDYRSYVEYECEKAKSDGLAIVVLYNSTRVDRDRCPDCIKWSGKHVAMRYYKNGQRHWDYQAVKEALS